MEIALSRGDLTRFAGDAIVNAANAALAGGGGVDGAIHAAAGPRLLEACRAIPVVARGVRCPPGEVRVTPGFDLPARFVIHTVGPIHDPHRDQSDVLRRCHVNALAAAEERGLRTIAFPAISCGVYGYPVEEAARIAVAAVRSRPWDLDRVEFVLFGDRAWRAWEAALAEPPT